MVPKFYPTQPTLHRTSHFISDFFTLKTLYLFTISHLEKLQPPTPYYHLSQSLRERRPHLNPCPLLIQPHHCCASDEHLRLLLLFWQLLYRCYHCTTISPLSPLFSFTHFSIISPSRSVVTMVRIWRSKGLSICAYVLVVVIAPLLFRWFVAVCSNVPASTYWRKLQIWSSWFFRRPPLKPMTYCLGGFLFLRRLYAHNFCLFVALADLVRSGQKMLNSGNHTLLHV